MTKYARVVIEVPIKDDDGEKEILDAVESHMTEFMTGHWGINDVEIHDRAYIADECNSDIVVKKEESK